VLIPGFDLIKKTAYDESCFRFRNFRFRSFYFALSKGKETAEKIAKAMSAIYDEMNLPYEIHVSK
jgi:homoserine kinase